MLEKKAFIIFLVLNLIFITLSVYKVILSWEIQQLYVNYNNLKIEHETLKEYNLKLTTQYYIENSPSNIEKKAKEILGMEKKKSKKIIIEVDSNER